MNDAPPLPPCYHDGAHDFSFIIPETSDGDVTLCCQKCGTIRRVPARGRVGPLDSGDEWEIRDAARKASAS